MITIKSDGAHQIPTNIEIRDIQIEENELEKLVECLKPDQQTIIFCEKRSKVDRICEFLRHNEIKNLPFYDDAKMTAQMRHTTLNLFQTKKLPILVCNNLASRGLDTMNAEHVIQLDYAKSPVDYI